MGKLIISLHISIDGFVAGTAGEMDWIHIDNELFDYVGSLTANANTAMYGRNTYEIMDNYWPTAGNQPNAGKHDKEHSEWYNRVNKLVLSNTMQGQDKDKVHFINELQLGEVKTALQTGNVLVFGSPGAIHTLFRHNMIDEMYLFINPVTLGSGISLFNGIQEKLNWRLQEHKSFSGGKVTALHYVKK